MRTICPRCGVKGKDNAEFCISCGQPLKAAVSSVPPTRISHAPVREQHSGKVVIDSPASTRTNGETKEVSVRYRSISPSDGKQSSKNWQTSSVQKHSSFKETILNHAPPTVVPADSTAPQAPLASPKLSPAPSPEQAPSQAKTVQTTTQEAATSHAGAASSNPIDNIPASIELVKKNSSWKNKITSDDLPPIGMQHIWYKITGIPDWNTLALIPASDDLNVLAVAHGLGTMAAREPCEFVRVVKSSLAETGDNKDTDEQKRQRSYPYEYFDLVAQLGDDATSTSVTQLTRELLGQFNKAKEEGVLKAGRVIVTIDSILSHPDAITIARSADKIIICVKIGDTSFGSLKKILATIDREKVIGCVAIRSA